MDKSKSKYISKSKSKKKQKKVSKEAIHIAKPPNLRKIDDDTVEIITYEEHKTVSGSFRKSFHELTKEDLEREYSATIDYKPNSSNIINQVDIQRGKSAVESDLGRACVKVRIDRDDEVSMHNHPERDLVQVKWERPSGGDIYGIIYLKSMQYNLKASYVKAADGRFIRYRIVDYSKSAQAYAKANGEWGKASFKDRKGYSDSVDYVIERMYQRMHVQELMLAADSKVLAPKLKQQHEQIQQRAFEEVNIITSDSKLTKRQKEVKIQERCGFWLERMNEIEAKAVRKNPKYIPKSKSSYQRELIIVRRTFNRWVNWLESEWGVEVKRMPKNFKDPILAA